MDRRDFLKSITACAATLPARSAPAGSLLPSLSASGLVAANTVSVDSHTRLASFARNGLTWTVYEDLRVRDGVLTFLGSDGSARVLRKTAEPTFAAQGPQHLGLELKNICLADADLLATSLLAHGDPLEEQVRLAAPPMNADHSGEDRQDFRPGWNTFVGTRECSDTMPVFPAGNTRTYHPQQYFRELTLHSANQRYEGLVGGWMPAVRKVIPQDDGSYFEVLVLGDVAAHDRFIVQTWHRTAHLRDGAILAVHYGYSYPEYTRRRQPPPPEDFYRGLLEFAEYWEQQTHDLTPIVLPDVSWTDMVRYAFVKEQMVRPGGVYPKYGAVDRDYYGSEYDGFQDTFTMSLYANLECGRFTQAREVFDNYFTSFVDPLGLVNMRGPETAQYGLTLFLVARYAQLTGDTALLLRYREKIEAMASLLAELHDQSLRLPPDNPGYGLLHGWCESDSCLMSDPAVWDKPYFANSAFAVRGWRAIAAAWTGLKLPQSAAQAREWSLRSRQLQAALIASLQANTWQQRTPPYIPPLPGAKLTFRESLARQHPSEQGWPHRCYTELLHPDVLPEPEANAVVDCMRSYGATTLGVVANVEPPSPYDREILGFISYGYAHTLLRLNRVEEYILFLYTHRYHCHSRGSWTAAEVSGITGGGALFCIPAQLTIPLLIRWMLVFEEFDEERLHFGRAIPRDWLLSHAPIWITGAPTRWGRVNYRLEYRGADALAATITLPEEDSLPEFLHISFRVPGPRTLHGATINGRATTFQGQHQDAIVVPTHGQRHFQAVALLA